jgi:hypothetical protein
VERTSENDVDQDADGDQHGSQHADVPEGQSSADALDHALVSEDVRTYPAPRIV